MFCKYSGKVATLTGVVAFSVVFASGVMAVNFPDRQGALLYAQLSQNIEQEATHYSNYTEYQGNSRIQSFWAHLKALNLTRDELIQTANLLEQSLERPISRAALSGVAVTSMRHWPSESPGSFARIFSHWRPFYFLISGGFFLINASLLLTVLCTTCRRNAIGFKNLISDEINQMTSMTSSDSRDYGILHKKDTGYRKAA